MSFKNRSGTRSTAEQITDAWSRMSVEAVNAIRTAAQTTHRELWKDSPGPDALAEALGADGQEAVAQHRAAVLFLATIAAIEAGSTVVTAVITAAATALTEGAGTAEAIPGANAAAAVIAALSPVRAILPGPDGSITIAAE